LIGEENETSGSIYVISIGRDDEQSKKRKKAGSFFLFPQTLYSTAFEYILTKIIQKRFGGDLQLLIFATRFEIKAW